MSDPKKAKVTLLGAGCHDSSWLTLAGKRALEEAQAVVYDDLVDPSLLELCPDAKKFYRGKRGHRASARQDEINQLMVDLAGKYQTVVRLKGGDPMIFGRGMEETEFLRNNKIQVEIIPGISSFYGVPAKEQLGLTLREKSRGFMVLTASSIHDQRTPSQWKNIAEFEGTRVFLMGLSKVKEIADSLMEAGLDPSTPCVIVTSPSFTVTRSVYAPLEDLAQKSEKTGLRSPGIILIGGSVPKKPFITPLKASLGCTPSLWKKISASLGQEVQCSSIFDTKIESVFQDWRFLEKRDPNQQTWLVFSSARGIDHFFEQLKESRIDQRKLAGIHFAAIGRQSARTLENYGIFADLIPQRENSAGLAKELDAAAVPGAKIILVQSEQANPQLALMLSSHHDVIEMPVYSIDYQLIDPSANADFLVFGSALQAKTWKEHPVVQKLLPVSGTIIAISAECAKILEGTSQQPVLYPDRPDAKLIADIILSKL